MRAQPAKRMIGDASVDLLLEKAASQITVKEFIWRAQVNRSTYYRHFAKLDDVELKDHYSLARSYVYSKLYVWWLMREFAERLAAAGTTTVTVNTCEPGSAITGLQRVSGKNPLMEVVMVLWTPFMQSVPKAAATSV